MAHPITEQLEKLDPPLAPDVNIEIYVSGVHKPGPEGYLIHAFGLVFHLSDGRKAKSVCSISDEHETTNDRAELGATLTAFEWLTLNAGRTNPVTILSAEEYTYHHLPRNISKWVEFRDAKNLDLIDRIFSHFNLWPNIQWQRAKLGPHPELQKKANHMARRMIDTINIEALVDRSEEALDGDDFLLVNAEFWKTWETDPQE